MRELNLTSSAPSPYVIGIAVTLLPTSWTQSVWSSVLRDMELRLYLLCRVSLPKILSGGALDVPEECRRFTQFLCVAMNGTSPGVMVKKVHNTILSLYTSVHLN